MVQTAAALSFEYAFLSQLSANEVLLFWLFYSIWNGYGKKTRERKNYNRYSEEIEERNGTDEQKRYEEKNMKKGTKCMLFSLAFLVHFWFYFMISSVFFFLQRFVFTGNGINVIIIWKKVLLIACVYTEETTRQLKKYTPNTYETELNDAYIIIFGHSFRERKIYII